MRAGKAAEELPDGPVDEEVQVGFPFGQFAGGIPVLRRCIQEGLVEAFRQQQVRSPLCPCHVLAQLT